MFAGVQSPALYDSGRPSPHSVERCLYPLGIQAKLFLPTSGHQRIPDDPHETRQQVCLGDVQRLPALLQKEGMITRLRPKSKCAALSSADNSLPILQVIN